MKVSATNMLPEASTATASGTLNPLATVVALPVLRLYFTTVPLFWSVTYRLPCVSTASPVGIDVPVFSVLYEPLGVTWYTLNDVSVT